MKNLHWLQQQSPIRLSQEEAREATEQDLWVTFSALVLKMKWSARPSGGWERAHQKAKIRQRKWGSPQTCLSSWEHLIALWCSWTLSSTSSYLFSKSLLSSSSPPWSLSSCSSKPSQLLTEKSTDHVPPNSRDCSYTEGDIFQGQDFTHYDSPGNEDYVY